MARSRRHSTFHSNIRRHNQYHFSIYNLKLIISYYPTVYLSSPSMTFSFELSKNISAKEYQRCHSISFSRSQKLCCFLYPFLLATTSFKAIWYLRYHVLGKIIFPTESFAWIRADIICDTSQSSFKFCRSPVAINSSCPSFLLWIIHSFLLASPEIYLMRTGWKQWRKLWGGVRICLIRQCSSEKYSRAVQYGHRKLRQLLRIHIEIGLLGKGLLCWMGCSDTLPWWEGPFDVLKTQEILSTAATHKPEAIPVLAVRQFRRHLRGYWSWVWLVMWIVLLDAGTARLLRSTKPLRWHIWFCCRFQRLRAIFLKKLVRFAHQQLLSSIYGTMSHKCIFWSFRAGQGIISIVK